MSVVYGLKLMCDLCLYLSVIGMVSLIVAPSPFVMLFAALLSLGAGAGFVLSRRGEPWRLIPLIPALLALFLAKSVFEVVLGVPMAVYSVLYVVKNHTATDHYYAFQRFRAGVIGLIALSLPASLLGPDGVRGAVPALFLHLTLSVALLRILRHEDRVIRQRRFQVINLLGLAGVSLLGWILASDAVLGAIKAALGFVYEQVILRILNLIFWMVGMILQALFNLLSMLPIHSSLDHFEMPQMLMPGADDGMMDALTSGEVAGNPTLELIVKIVGILVGCVLLFLILRLLSRHQGRIRSTEQREERESLDTPVDAGRKPGLIRRMRDPTLGVRYTYQRFLKKARERGVPLNGRQNSRQVRDLSMDEFDEKALSDLREVYIRARYGGESSPDDVRLARDAYGRLNQKKD